MTKANDERMWYLKWNYAVKQDGHYHARGWRVPRLRDTKKWAAANAKLARDGLIDLNADGYARITPLGLEALRKHRSGA